MRVRNFVLKVLRAAAIAGLGTLACVPSASAEDAAARQTPAALEAAARRYFPSDEQKVPQARLFRLTRDQIDATVASLLPDYVPQPVKAVMARDPLQTNYEYADLLGVNAANSGALTGWIKEIAARVAKNPAGVINCPAKAAADDCHKTQARRFVVKAFRGDASDEKIDTIVTFYLAGVKSAGAEQAASDLVEIVLNSPHFLFRKEIDVTKGNRLVPAQLLQSVSYTIADAPPDALNLKSENASQYLRSGAEAATTINTIVASPASRAKLMRFFKAWLEVREPADYTISREVFPDFTPKFASQMVDDTQRFLTTQLSKPAPKLKDITQSIEGFNIKDSKSAPASDAIAAKLADLDGPQRLGIFSMPSVLASHSGPTNSRPIKRGVFWARKVMCMEMEPPPKHLEAKLYELKGATERQRVEQSTNLPACAGCHKIINPLGFFQESYDALGRWRTLDNNQPIDTSILIDFLDESAVKTRTPVEALSTMTSSLMFKQCFVRQMFRFYMGRNEEPSDDPVLRRMFLTFTANDDQDILKTLYTLTSSDRIVQRR